MDRLPEGAVAAALTSIGVDVLTQDGDELIALCPGHEERTGKKDGHPSWSINEETGVHYCFSCGYKGNLITLVRDLRGEGAADLFRTEFEAHKRVLLSDPDFDIKIEMPTADRIRTANFRPESWLDGYVDPPRWALKARRITAVGAKEYGIRWDAKTEAWILPLRDPETDRLLGYQKKSQRTRLFRNRPRSVPKSETFFGWQAVRDGEVVVVVESPLDAVLLADMYVPAVAVCGSRLSDNQLGLLRDGGFKKIVFWMDDDTAGNIEMSRVQSALREWGVPAEFITAESYPEITSGKDVGELSFEDIGAVLDAAGV